jgi:protein tyrosine phosphatase
MAPMVSSLTTPSQEDPLSPSSPEFRLIFPTRSLESRQQHALEVAAGIEKRWAKVSQAIPSFLPYEAKSEEDIKEEYHKVNRFRHALWFSDPYTYPRVCQPDYEVAQDLLEKGYYRTINTVAFAYNPVDSSYNASTILVEGLHFIALQEPTPSQLNSFFKLLINQGVSALVRVKPEGEYAEQGSIPYWANRVTEVSSVPFLEIDLMEEEGWGIEPHTIPYFCLNSWVDGEGIGVADLYELVQKVRHTYHQLKTKGPIACHCAAGVGRTGTFIAAFVLAEMLDKSPGQVPSIQELVLKLSIQRSYMVASAAQYLTLYQFVDYYLHHHTGS